MMGEEIRNDGWRGMRKDGRVEGMRMRKDGRGDEE